jgi:hypothetical protein
MSKEHVIVRCCVCMKEVQARVAYRTGGRIYHEHCLPRSIIETQWNTDDRRVGPKDRRIADV